VAETNPPVPSQLRLDPLTGRWVVVTHRPEGPVSFSTGARTGEHDQPDACPFCPGNEAATPPAVQTYGPEGRWLLRVVPNLRPAFSGVGPIAVKNIGPVFTQSPASGTDEVLVLSPDHDATWPDLTDTQASFVMTAIRDRAQDHSSRHGLRYTQAVVNWGREAGALLVHLHGQLLGMPFVPGEIVDEQAGFARFAGACLLCTTLEAEEDARHRLVLVDDRVVVVCPFWSGSPYEMLVLPRAHERYLHAAHPSDVAAVGVAIRDALAALRRAVADAPYNVVFHSAPYRARSDFHWHVHLLPKLMTNTGFELGTGVMFNVLAPEQAATELRPFTTLI
jgi:UDPglucose--hexose-1-phosphate uridylyltransferase